MSAGGRYFVKHASATCTMNSLNCVVSYPNQSAYFDGIERMQQLQLSQAYGCTSRVQQLALQLCGQGRWTCPPWHVLSLLYDIFSSCWWLC